nr:leucine-rich repeat domain-containing protein [Candidatus Sigynarchaeota archaeon]
MNEFQINEYIVLKLENEQAVIYVNGERFNQCKFLLFSVDLKESEKYDEIGSIDEAAEKLDRSMEHRGEERLISVEEEFWGHCSNLQAWAEHDYDTRLLHSNLAFPLLKKLTESGDPKAQRVFKEEIMARIRSGFFNTIAYLVSNGYADYLNPLDLSHLLGDFLESSKEDTKLTQIAATGLFDRLNEQEFILMLEHCSEHVLLLKDMQGENWMAKSRRVSFLSEDGTLDLSYSDLEDLSQIKGLETIKGLKILKLGGNKLDQNKNNIPVLKNVSKLDLSANQLEALPEWVGNFVNLEELDLSDNHLCELPGFVKNFRLLRDLVLKSNEFTSIPQVLMDLPCLDRLFLSHNKIDIFPELPKSNRGFPSLQSLLLRKNLFSMYPDSISRIRHLKHADLRDNKLGVATIESMEKDLQDQIARFTRLMQAFFDSDTIHQKISSHAQLVESTLEKMMGEERFTINYCDLCLLLGKQIFTRDRKKNAQSQEQQSPPSLERARKLVNLARESFDKIHEEIFSKKQSNYYEHFRISILYLKKIMDLYERGKISHLVFFRRYAMVILQAYLIEYSR